METQIEIYRSYLQQNIDAYNNLLRETHHDVGKKIIERSIEVTERHLNMFNKAFPKHEKDSNKSII